MKISEYLVPERAFISDADSKQAILEELASSISTSTCAPSKEHILDAILRREEILSTGIGQGLAVPHVRIHGVEKLTIAAALLRAPVAYGSLDEQPALVVVMVLAPPGTHRQYLRVLSSIVRQMKDEAWRHRLFDSSNHKDVYNRFCEVQSASDTICA